MERGSNQGLRDVKPSATFVKTDARDFKEVVQRLTGMPGQTVTPQEVENAAAAANTKRPTTSRNRPKLHIIKPGPYSRPPTSSSSDRLISPSKSRDSGGTIPSPRTAPSPKEIIGEQLGLGIVPLDSRKSRNRPNLRIVPPAPLFRPLTGDFSPSKSSNGSAIPSPGLTPTSKFSMLSLLPENNGEPPEFTMLDKQEEQKAVNEGRFYIHPSPRSRPCKPELLNLFPLTSPREERPDQSGG